MDDFDAHSPYRFKGFYQLKKIFGLGDDNLKMIIALGALQPTFFQDGKQFVKKYQICAVNDALLDLRGRNVKEEYLALLEEQKSEEGADMKIVRVKFEDVKRRLDRKERRKASRKAIEGHG